MDPLILQKMKAVLLSLIEDNVLVSKSENGRSGIDVSFLAPNGDFVSSLGSEPTINCYLIGLNEDKVRRKSESHRGTLNSAKTSRTVRPEPRFVDLTYMLTVWNKDKEGSAEIEHLVLGYLLCGLGGFDFLPEAAASQKGLDIMPYGVRMCLFGSEYSEKISGQIWQAMGSTPKPCLMLSMSVPVDVHEPIHTPLVQEVEKVLKKSN